jgi:hypothetical protein
LEADRINTLLPEPLPPDIPIAHKTGSLNDTLNDAGIVFAGDAPYVIAVMTTALPSADTGRSFIHSVSRIAYTSELRLAQWRQAEAGPQITHAAPDDGYWNGGNGSVDTPAGASGDTVDDAPTAPPSL